MTDPKQRRCGVCDQCPVMPTSAWCWPCRDAAETIVESFKVGIAVAADAGEHESARVWVNALTLLLPLGALDA